MLQTKIDLQNAHSEIRSLSDDIEGNGAEEKGIPGKDNIAELNCNNEANALAKSNRVPAAGKTVLALRT